MIYYNANTRKRFSAIVKHPDESFVIYVMQVGIDCGQGWRW